MLLIGLKDRRVVIVAGKGGVGKTTVAASMAAAWARSGARTLVISTDPAHSLSDVLESNCGSGLKQIEPGLEAMEIDAEALAAKHVQEVARAMKSLAHPDTWPDIDKQLAASRTAPGTVEAALVEYLAGLMPDVSAQYDRVILDTAPTGHTLRLLTLPSQLGDWTDELIAQRKQHDRIADRVGRPDDPRHQAVAQRLQARREKLATAQAVFTDPARTGALVVLTPERLPILESERLIQGLEKAGVDVAGLVVNGILPESSTDEFMQQRRNRQQRHLETIERSFHRFPAVRLRLAVEDPTGVDALTRIGNRLLGKNS